MSERRDDTPETEPRGHGRAEPPHERAPGSYYYDDATGYEVFDPEEEGEEDDDADESDPG